MITAKNILAAALLAWPMRDLGYRAGAPSSAAAPARRRWRLIGRSGSRSRRRRCRLPSSSWSFAGPSAPTTRTSCGAASRCSRKSARTATRRICCRSATSRRRAAGIFGRAGQGAGRDLQDRTIPMPMAASVPACRRITGRRRSRPRRTRAMPMAARCRPTCRCSPRRAASSDQFPWWLFNYFTTYRRAARTTSTPSSTAITTDRRPASQLPDGKYYNEYFPGHAIGMPPPLTDGQVKYAAAADGSTVPLTVDQYSQGRCGVT